MGSLLGDVLSDRAVAVHVMVVHDLAEAAAEGPAFGLDPGKEGVGEVVQGGVGGDFTAAVELDFFAGGGRDHRRVMVDS